MRQRIALFLILLLSATVALAQQNGGRNRRPTNPPNNTPTPPPQTPPPTTPPPATPPPPQNNAGLGQPLQGLTPAQLASFMEGREDFEEVETVEDGLGPVFNERSCVECHRAGGIGGAGRRNVTRIGTVRNGVFDPLVNFGGSLMQDRAIGPRDGSTHAFQPDRPPQQATIVIRRRTTPLFGLGFVDATPDSVFVALAADQAVRNPATAGRVAFVQNISAGMNTVGKFGWKAQVPTLFQFAGDAYLNEVGITNPEFPTENCPRGNCAELAFNPVPALNDLGEGVRALTAFMRLLAAPPRGAITPEVTAGEQVFANIGCASCHTPTLRTGSSDVAALNQRTYSPYSDFLLHDMGSLGDGIEQGAANGREIRTAPLWGLRAQPTLLHDGRVETIEAAIAAHDGQGRASRDRFNGLDPAARAQLLAFLRSL